MPNLLLCGFIWLKFSLLCCEPYLYNLLINLFFIKDNRRYYKVKWVKTTWESEDDLAYFSGVIDSFWAQYTKECLMQSEDVNKNDVSEYI